jgi:uncharacterized protein
VQTQAQQSSEVPCGSCNACCRSSYFIHIRADELETLRRIPPEYLARAPRPDVGDWIMDQNHAGRCPMLRADGCSIYAHRPQTCRNYDCRAFAAAGISLGSGPRSAVNERVWQWRFEYPTDLDAQRHNAVRSAAVFLRQHSDLFPAQIVPTDPGQLAKSAIGVHGLFLELGAPSVPTTRDASDADFAAAIRRRLRSLLGR